MVDFRRAKIIITSSLFTFHSSLFFPDNAPEGVEFDEDSLTLTLDGAEITASGGDATNKAGIYWSDTTINTTLTIVIKGDNSIDITNVDKKENYGIYGDFSDTGKLLIKGSGSLSIKGDGEALRNGIHISHGNLTIDGPEELDIDVNNNANTRDCRGVYVVKSDLTIEDTVLKIKSDGHGVYVYGDTTIEDTVLNIKSGGIYAYGIFSFSGDLTLEDCRGSIVAGGGYGIYSAKVLTIDGCDFHPLAGEDHGIESTNMSIYAMQSVEIDDSNIKVKVINDDRGHAIYSRGVEDGSNDEDRPGIVLGKNIMVVKGGDIVPVYDWSGDKPLKAKREVLYGWAFSSEQDRIRHPKPKVISGEGENEKYLEGPPDTHETEVILVRKDEYMEFFSILLMGVGRSFPFIDVPDNHWARPYVEQAWKQALIDGKTEALFMPDGNLTYAEAIKLAAAAHQLQTMGGVSFEPSDPWYKTYADYAELNQIIDPGQFSGQMKQAISRYDFAYIFAHTLGESGYSAIKAVDSIPDVPASHKYFEDILKLYRAKILTGDENGNFNGNNNIKRSEAAAILIKLIDPEKR